MGAQISAARGAVAAQQVGHDELARVRDALKAVNASAKESSAAVPNLLAALRDAKPSQRLPSPAHTSTCGYASAGD